MSHKGARLLPNEDFKPKWYRSFMLVNTAAARLSSAQIKEFEAGGKLLLPENLLEELVDKDVFKQDRPLHFRVHSVSEMIVCYCGVDEFSLESQQLCMPQWMQEFTGSREGDSIVLASVELPLCSKLTLKPDSCDFYDISDAKSALQSQLPNFSAISKGENFRFIYEDKFFWMKVVHCEPAVGSLINCDVHCDFESADGLERYEIDKQKEELFTMFADGRQQEVQGAATSSFEVVQAPSQNGNQFFDKESFGGRGRKL